MQLLPGRTSSSSSLVNPLCACTCRNFERGQQQILNPFLRARTTTTGFGLGLRGHPTLGLNSKRAGKAKWVERSSLGFRGRKWGDGIDTENTRSEEKGQDRIGASSRSNFISLSGSEKRRSRTRWKGLPWSSSLDVCSMGGKRAVQSRTGQGGGGMGVLKRFASSVSTPPLSSSLSLSRSQSSRSSPLFLPLALSNSLPYLYSIPCHRSFSTTTYSPLSISAHTSISPSTPPPLPFPTSIHSFPRSSTIPTSSPSSSSLSLSSSSHPSPSSSSSSSTTMFFDSHIHHRHRDDEYRFWEAIENGARAAEREMRFEQQGQGKMGDQKHDTSTNTNTRAKIGIVSGEKGSGGGGGGGVDGGKSGESGSYNSDSNGNGQDGGSGSGSSSGNNGNDNGGSNGSNGSGGGGGGTNIGNGGGGTSGFGAGGWGIGLNRGEGMLMRCTILDASGSVRVISGQLKKTDLCSEHGLQPRDLRKIDSRIPNVVPTILVRKQCILVNILHIRALIKHDSVYLFDTYGAQDSSFHSVFLYNLGHNLRLGPRASGGLPYEFRALEAMLSSVSQALESEQSTLRNAVVDILDGLEADIDREKLKLLLQFSRRLGVFEKRASLVQECLDEVLEQDDDLAAMYLTQRNVMNSPRDRDDHEELELLLESFSKRIEEIVNETENLTANVKSTEEIVELILDSNRNQLLALDLKVSIGTFGIGTGALVASLFGMNLTSHFESHPSAFYVASSTACILAAIVGIYGLRRLHQLRRIGLGSGTVARFGVLGMLMPGKNKKLGGHGYGYGHGYGGGGVGGGTGYGSGHGRGSYGGGHEDIGIGGEGNLDGNAAISAKASLGMFKSLRKKPPKWLGGGGSPKGGYWRR